MKLRIATKIALLTFVLVLITAGSVWIVGYTGINAVIVRNELERLKNAVLTRADPLVMEIQELSRDVQMLVETAPVQEIARIRAERGAAGGASEEFWRKRLAILCTAILHAKPTYVQARLIGAAGGGREIVQVHRSGEAIVTVPDGELQPKEDTAYFKEAIRLRKGEVYLSPVELNREHGQVQVPHLPVIRAATPVFTPAGKAMGIIVINLDFSRRLKLFHELLPRHFQPFITNDAGDFLLHPDPTRAFGFDLGRRYRIQEEYPELAGMFEPGSSEREIMVHSGPENDGRDVYFLKVPFDPNRLERFLGMALAVSRRELLAEANAVRDRSLLLSLFLVAAFTAAAFYFSRLVVRPLRQITQATETLASLDSLATDRANVPLPVEQGNEIGVLARSFQKMVQQLRQREEEIRRLNEELEQRVIERTAELEAANKELEAFSYSVSHDLRAPLRAIDGFTRILVEDYEPQLDAEGKRVCFIIHNNTEKMGRLIDDLLAFSRLGRLEMQFSRIDMGTLANSVFHELTTPESRGRIDFDVGSLPPAVGDPTLIRQVWMNLLSNALKFSSRRERAVIQVKGERGEGEVIYSVQDNGAGFDMKYIDKLFGVFHRLHNTREFEGSGVGLAIVQRIIHRHGGRVWAEGATDKGATFCFTLQQKGT